MEHSGEKKDLEQSSVVYAQIEFGTEEMFGYLNLLHLAWSDICHQNISLLFTLELITCKLCEARFGFCDSKAYGAWFRFRNVFPNRFPAIAIFVLWPPQKGLLMLSTRFGRLEGQSKI